MGGPVLFTPPCLPLRGSTPQSAAHTHGALFQTSLGPTTSPHTQETQRLGGGLFLVPVPSLTVNRPVQLLYLLCPKTLSSTLHLQPLMGGLPELGASKEAA